MTMQENSMSLLALDARFGPGSGFIGKSLTLVQIVAANTSTTLYQLSPEASTVWLVCIMVYNDHSADINLSIGTGDFTALLPQLGPILVSMHEVLWIPPTEFTADIVVQSDGAGASPGEVEVMGYVFEPVP